jgi:hypothetical protein
LQTLQNLFGVDAHESKAVVVEARKDIYFDMGDLNVGLKLRDEKDLEVRAGKRVPVSFTRDPRAAGENLPRPRWLARKVVQRENGQSCSAAVRRPRVNNRVCCACLRAIRHTRVRLFFRVFAFTRLARVGRSTSASSSKLKPARSKHWTMVKISKRRWGVKLKSGDDMEVAYCE